MMQSPPFIRVRNMMKQRLIFTAFALMSGLGYTAEAMIAPTAHVISAQRTALFDLVKFNGSLFAVGERGVVMRSDDSGRTWYGRQAPTDRTLVSLVVIDKNTAIAVGHGATIVRTDDGGENWQAVGVEDAGEDSLLGVTLLSDGGVVAYGAYGLYLESADRGRSWARRKVVSEDFEWHISGVREAGGRLYLVGESGTIAVSDDLGDSWTKLASPYEGSFFGLLELEGGALLAYGMRGNVFRSEDMGNTWQPVPFDSKSAINGGTVGSDGRVVLVGNNGLLATSSDGGRHFDLRVMPEGTPLAKAAYAKDGSLVYVGYLAAGRLTGEQAGITRD